MPKTAYVSNARKWKKLIRISPKISLNALIRNPPKNFMNIHPQLSEQSYLMSKNALSRC